MRAMVLDQMGEKLKLQEVPIPIPNAFELLIRVKACGSNPIQYAVDLYD